VNKRNLIIQAAVAGVFGAVSLSAFAGVANGIPAQLAAQAVPLATTPIATGSLAYSTQSPVAIGTAYVYVKLNGGAKFVQAAASSLNAATLVAANTGATAVVTVGAGVVSTDQTFAVYPITVTAASLPVNTTFTFKATGVAAATGGVTNVAFLGTAPASLTGTISIGSITGAATTLADIDSAATGNLVNTVNGETFAALQSGAATFVTAMGGAAVETKQINVTSSTGVALTAGTTSNTGASTTTINFGGYKFTDVPAVLAADAATAFNIATNYTVAYNAVLTGSFLAAQGTGGRVFLSYNDATCATVSNTAVINAAGTTATFSAIAATATATPTFVCMQINNSNAVVIPATTPSLVVTLVGTTAATANITTPAATLYALNTNGATHDVMSYLPAATAGYTTYIRVINTGGVAANISAAVIDAVTGVAGTSAVIIPSLAAGGATNVSSATIEAAITAAGGTVPAVATRPRLRVTAPSNITVQSYILTNANGTFSEVSSGE